MREILPGYQSLLKRAFEELSREYGPDWRKLLRHEFIEAYLGYTLEELADGGGFHEVSTRYGGKNPTREGEIKAQAQNGDLSFLTTESFRNGKRPYRPRLGGYPSEDGWVRRR